MARQGCRNHRFLWQPGCFVIAVFCVSLSNLMAAGDDLGSKNVDFRLELTWNSEAPRIWAGELTVVDELPTAPEANRLSEPGNLTAGMLLSGGIQLTPARDRLLFSPPPSTIQLRGRDGRFVSRRTTRGGISFRVTGRTTDQVMLSLRAESSRDIEAPVAIRLGDLIDGQSIQGQVDESARWSLRRVDGDRLRVTLVPRDRTQSHRPTPTTEAGTSLFWDDQQAEILVTSDVELAEPADLVCDTLADGVQVVATQSWPIVIEGGRGVIEHATWQPPLGDGSYELRWRLQRKSTGRSVMGVAFPSNFSESITKPMTLIRRTNDSGVIAESKATVVVLSRQPQDDPASLGNESLIVLGRIEPFGRSWAVSRLLPLRQATQLISQSSNDLKKSSLHDKQVAELSPGGQWQHTLPVSKVGQPHRLVLHLPDGQAMRLGIRISDHSSQGGSQTVIRDVTCIRTRMTTGNSKWVTAEVDYYPQSTSPQLTLINRDPLLPASFEALDILVVDTAKHLENGSPIAAPQAKRSRTALMHLESSQWLGLFGDLTFSEDGTKVQRGNVLSAALRLADSVRTHGFGGVMLTVCEDGRALYRTDSVTADMTGDGGVPKAPDGSPETLELLMRLFDRQSLALVPCIRPNFPLTSLENAIASGHLSTRGIAASSPWSGQSLDLSLNELETYPGGLYNPTDEMASAQATVLVRELAAHCRPHACVQTIGVVADEGSYLRLPPPRATMDSVTLDRFHAALPADTISRSQLIGWIGDQGAAAFEQWRRERLRELYDRMVGALEDGSRSLMVISTTQQPPTELLDANPQSRLLVTRLYRRAYLDSLAAQCRDESVSGMTASPSDSWKETSLPAAIFIAPESRGDAVAAEAPSPSTLSPLIDPVSSSLTLTKLLSRGDRRFVAISGTLCTGENDVRRRSLARFQSLPAVLMDDVLPSDEAMKLVKLRRVVHEGSTYLVGTNHCRWPMALHASLSGAVGARAVLPADAPPTIASDGSWHATLQAGELVAIQIPGATVSVSAWSAQLAAGASQISEIGLMVRELADAIAAITEPHSYDCIENPGFEEVRSQSAAASSTVDVHAAAAVPNPVSVPGWLMAQYPEGCAAVDDQVAHEGKFSVRLRNHDGRPGATWIMSRAVPPPASGRLAMSLMLRGEPSEAPADAPAITVRVAIEGTVGGSSVQASKLVQVSRDGQWGSVPCHLAVDSLPRCGVESLRLTIDVMNEGTVWIDSVRADDFFMTNSEKSQLQSQMFLALGGLTKGELSHTARMLESHWIQYRLGLPMELSRPPLLTAPKTLDITGSSDDNREEHIAKPGLAERLRGWLPRPIRF